MYIYSGARGLATSNNMRVIVIVLIFATVGQADWSGYHLREGIPEAQRIRRADDLVFDKIVGGTIAPVHQHPYLAGLVIDLVGIPHNSACGGSIISNSRILTAAHCWNDGNLSAWRFTVVVGSPYLYYGGLRIATSTLAPHPLYNARTLANDIAILYLPIHIPFSDAIRPVVLPTGAWINFDLQNHWGMASGYGRYSDVTNPTMNTVVRNVFLRVITNEECARVYGDIVQESNLCTCGQGGVGICRGDSGGPLTVQNAVGQDVLVGVSSFVANDGCKLGHPSAFARVTSYIDWIRLHM